MHEEAGQNEEDKKLDFHMPWDEDAKNMLSMVPGEFQAKAVEGTEEYARKHKHSRITARVVEQYRKELGF